MSSKQIVALKPFISLVMIIMTLFALVFLQMEERRMGYTVLKLNREHKKVIDMKRAKNIELARLNRPQLLESVAQKKLTLQKVQSSQIIHLSGVTAPAEGSL